jgi:hypothetical protein
MPEAYADDASTVAADNPFAVILRRPAKSLILIPARRSASNYAGSRIADRDVVRRYLNACRSNFASMAGVRRLYAEVQHEPGAIHRDDGKIFEAVAEAVARGRIYAVLAENERDTAEAPATSAINYGALASRFLALAKEDEEEEEEEEEEPDFFAFLTSELPARWCDAYSVMPKGEGEIVAVTDEGFTFLFDLDAERVVVAFGTSRYNPARRDSGRMAGFLGKVTSASDLARIGTGAGGRQRQALAQMTWRDRFFQTYGHKYDRGHFMSHRQGGGLDINLFPQRADINQGHGAQGALYRRMERACVDDEVFCFSRPVYEDGTWVPVQLEYGVVHGPRRMSVVMFPNR